MTDLESDIGATVTAVLPGVDHEVGDRYRARQGRIYLTGLQALVRLTIEQRRIDEDRGLRGAAFISGYEGSPLAGYDLELMRNRDLLDDHAIVIRPAVNEELAVNAVQGSQLSSQLPDARYEGVTGYWYGKAPGLDRASDALRHANLGGSSPRGGAVVIVGDDAGAKSSSVPSSSEMALAELGLPVLVPADPPDILELGRHAVALSRFSGLWVGMKINTDVADGAATAVVDTPGAMPTLPDNTVSGTPYVHIPSAQFIQPALGRLEHSLAVERTELARRYIAANDLNQTVGDPAATVGVVAAGATYLDVRQALARLGVRLDDAGPGSAGPCGVRVLKLGAVYPLDSDEIVAFCEGLDELIVVEEKRAFVETRVKSVLQERGRSIVVTGKQDPAGRELIPTDGQLGVARIAAALARRLRDRGQLGPDQAGHPANPATAGVTVGHIPVPTGPGHDVFAVPGPDDSSVAALTPTRRPLPLVTRSPYFCSGCPHNRSTRVPDGSLVGAGIGCSGLSLLMPTEVVGNVIGLTQMGGEGATWIGMAPFVETTHMLQNLGDGTYHHSGSLAVRAAVAGGVNITYKLLYNSAVAMTGGQQAVGNMSVANLTHALQAEGVRRVVVTTDDPRRYRRVKLAPGTQVRHRDELIAVQEELAAVPGVTVLIHDQECATELRRKRKRGLATVPDKRIFINERVCEGCGDCGQKSNCLSVEPVPTEFGRKTQIHQASCNQDFSCLDGDCPSFVEVVPSIRRRRLGSASRDASGRAQHEGSPPPVAHLAANVFPEPVQLFDSARFAMRITGIGGTGVVTLSQVISLAAAMSGRWVRSLDQTGLAQKGGAVVSDIKIWSDQQVASNRLAPGECDLYLGCDLLVASSEDNLAVLNQHTSFAVVSSSQVPTGSMVSDPSARFPDDHATIDQIVERVGSRSRFVSAREATQALLGDDKFANVLLLGAAFQLGAFPVSAQAVEAALTANGVSTSANIQAFRRGRQMVADRDAFDALVDGRQAHVTRGSMPGARARVEPATRPSDVDDSDVDDLVRRRSRDLAAYQGRAYAQRYEKVLASVHDAESKVKPGGTELTQAVAHNLYKLMAYKDEYEVARLHLDPEFTRRIEHEFGPRARITYRLHPPVLRSLGVKRKLRFGPWFRLVFQLLHAMRWVRGTWIDPFGYAKVRRVERRLVSDYVRVIDQLIALLSPAVYHDAVQIAALPDMVRGYETIKLTNVEAYATELARLLHRLDALRGEEVA